MVRIGYVERLNQESSRNDLRFILIELNIIIVFVFWEQPLSCERTKSSVNREIRTKNKSNDCLTSLTSLTNCFSVVIFNGEYSGLVGLAICKKLRNQLKENAGPDTYEVLSKALANCSYCSWISYRKIWEISIISKFNGWRFCNIDDLLTLSA